MPEEMPDRMPRDHQGRAEMPEKMPKKMAQDMPERVPDRMARDMRRMSHGMPEEMVLKNKQKYDGKNVRPNVRTYDTDKKNRRDNVVRCFVIKTWVSQWYVVLVLVLTTKAS